MNDDEEWRAAGFTDADRNGFHEWRIGLADAQTWRSVGVFDGLTAARWQIAKITPQESSRWRTAGFDSVEALQWRQMGHSLASAREAKQAGRKPSPPDNGYIGVSSGPQRTSFASHVAHMAKGPVGDAFSAWLEKLDVRSHHLVMTYARMGWVSDDALPWVRRGIEPAEARLWILLGLRAEEAATQEKSAFDVTREWWSAGIPLDQVGAWLGAGFNAEEALEQIAAGVDAEQAAVLRALRDPTDE